MTINKSSVKEVNENNTPILVVTSQEPKENGFYDAELNGQEVELLIGGPPCSAL